MTDALGTPPDNDTSRSAGRIIARNTLFGVGAQLALRVASFIFTVLVVRTLGDEKFGQYSIVLAWAGLFSVIGDLGINQYLAREIASKKSASEALFWDTVVLRLMLAVAASIITVGGALLLTDYTSDIILGIALFTATYFFMALVAPVQS
ncbi:MAG: oligosaccharide flippase family protein, partial [Anaerolineae bacterium]|nr:oligosaccharide flippase family protein [Anaerolineae bacterium]